MKQLVIGFIAPDMVSTSFVMSLTDALRRDSYSHRIVNNRVIHVRCGPILDHGRNSLVRHFLATDHRLRWLLMVDADMTFRYEDIVQIAETAHATERPVVSGLYFRTDASDGIPKPVIYGRLSGDETLGVPVLDYPRGQIFEVGYVGMGFCLISRDLLETMRERLGETWFSYMGDSAEDFAFCRRVHDVGGSVWCDAGVRLGHVKSHIITEDDYLESRLMRLSPTA